MEYFMHYFSVYNENKKGTFFFFFTDFRSLWLLQNPKNKATPLCFFFFKSRIVMLICFLSNPFQITKSINRFLNPSLHKFCNDVSKQYIPIQQKLIWKTHQIYHCSNRGLFIVFKLNKQTNKNHTQPEM